MASEMPKSQTDGIPKAFCECHLSVIPHGHIYVLTPFHRSEQQTKTLRLFFFCLRHRASRHTFRSVLPGAIVLRGAYEKADEAAW